MFSIFLSSFPMLLEIRSSTIPLPMFISASNDVRGIGRPVFSRSREYGSEGKLQGIIVLHEYRSLLTQVMVHELTHRWAAHILNSDVHWGRISANSPLGGFNVATLKSHEDGSYTACYGNNSLSNPPDVYGLPMPPIDLYLAGLVPPEEVPDLVQFEGSREFYPADFCDGSIGLIATSIRTHSIDDIIERYGNRFPDHSQSQKDFRAAVILLVNKKHPPVRSRLDRVSHDAAFFSQLEPVSRNGTLEQYNFYEFTGGRATLTAAGLSEFVKVEDQSRVSGVKATGTPVPSSTSEAIRAARPIPTSTPEPTSTPTATLAPTVSPSRSPTSVSTITPVPETGIILTIAQSGVIVSRALFLSIDADMLHFRRADESISVRYRNVNGLSLSRKVGPSWVSMTAEELPPGSIVSLYSAIIDCNEVVTNVFFQGFPLRSN